MDEKLLSEILERIDQIRTELTELENDVRDLSKTSGKTGEKESDAQEASVLQEEPIDLSISISDIKEVPESSVESSVDGTSETAEKARDEEVHEEPAAESHEAEGKLPPESHEKPEEKKHRKPRGKKSLMDSEPVERAVIDVMEEKEAWRTDIPGSPVKNILSAISLNDRILLINSLFKGDPVLFQDTIAKFNAFKSLDEALEFVGENFKDWNLNSEPVYRLMMAARRKLQQ